MKKNNKMKEQIKKISHITGVKINPKNKDSKERYKLIKYDESGLK